MGPKAAGAPEGDVLRVLESRLESVPPRREDDATDDGSIERLPREAVRA